MINKVIAMYRWPQKQKEELSPLQRMERTCGQDYISFVREFVDRNFPVPTETTPLVRELLDRYFPMPSS